MRNIDALIHKVEAMASQLLIAPRTWVVNQEAGLDVPQEVCEQMKPGDSLVIHEYPRNYFGADDFGPTFYWY